jgi:SAM-dependent methyltransferase
MTVEAMAEHQMLEPHRTQFAERIRSGAGGRDIHDGAESLGYATESRQLPESFVARELNRVAAHQRTLCPLLESFVGQISRVLDVGCSTGGTTVAIALSRVMNASEVIGVDPNAESIAAAQIRVSGYPEVAERVRFQHIGAGAPLPFADNSFELCTTVSVLEFVTSAAGRAYFASEMVRVTKPGGHIFLATPTSWRLREFHSRRWLGNQIRRDGFPWSSSRLSVNQMFEGCEPISVARHDFEALAERRRLPGSRLMFFVAPLILPLLPWQKFLFRKL